MKPTVTDPDSVTGAERLDSPPAASTGAVAPRPVMLGLWQLAWPAVLANLLLAVVGLVDVWVVGALGAAPVAAITTGTRVFFVLQAVLMGITTGTTALVARASGAGDRDEAERVTRVSLGLCVGIGAAMSVGGVVLGGPVAAAFRVSPDAVQLAETFIRTLSLFSIPFAIHFALGAAVRAAGDMRTPLYVAAGTNVINVVLCYSLVYGRLGLPSYGPTGAALASGTAYTVGSLVFLGLWWARRLAIGPGGRGAMTAARVRAIVGIGAPAALEQGLFQVALIWFMWLVSFYGTAAFAAYGIGLNMLLLVVVVGFGIGLAGGVLVGHHLGARDPAGATRSGWRASAVAIGVMSVLGAGVALRAESIALFFVDDPEVVRVTVVFIYVLAVSQPLMALEFALGGALRGAGDTRFPLLVVVSGLLGARVLLAGTLTWLGAPVEWVYAALIADYVIKASLLVWRFRSGRWKTALG